MPWVSAWHQPTQHDPYAHAHHRKSSSDHDPARHRGYSQIPSHDTTVDLDGAGSQKPSLLAKLGSSRLLGILQTTEATALALDRSLYGAAFVMPQVARSAGWPKFLCVLSLRAYMFLIVNYIAQGIILLMIGKEASIWSKFSGMMHLCDFGVGAGECPGGVDCLGPSGKEYNPGRVYGWDLWSMRTFIRDSAQQALPHLADQINSEVDPGDYGNESYWCRVLCIFLFMVSVMSDLNGSLNMIKTLYWIPNEAGYWLDYEVPEWGPKEEVKEKTNKSELDFVFVRVAGMPKMWKFVNLVCVVLPKLLIWKTTAEFGVMFLMETSSIQDLVVNSMALSFILQIDELLYYGLMSNAMHAILDKLEDFDTLDQEPEDEISTNAEALAKYANGQLSPWSLGDFVVALFWKVPPFRLFVLVALAGGLMQIYYMSFCEKSAYGGWISRPVHLPTGTVYTVLNAFLGAFYPVAQEEEPYWKMPEFGEFE